MMKFNLTARVNNNSKERFIIQVNDSAEKLNQ